MSSSCVTAETQDAIIGFFNVFSDKLRLQECKVISEVTYLLHTVVQFIQSGCLKYCDHSGFGFMDTVDFLRQQLQPCFYSILNPKSAEQGEELDCAKIFVALLYAFRLLRTEIFEEWVDSLPLKSHSQIAKIVEYLDDPDIWTSPLSWPEILTMSSDDSNGDASSLACSPRFDASTSVVYYDATSFLETPDRSFAVKKMHIYKSSPISMVLKFPRGSNALKVNQLQRSLTEIRERMESLSSQLDECQSRNEWLEKNSKELWAINNRLEEKLSELRLQLKQKESEEAQNTDLIAQISSLARENNNLHVERNASLDFRLELVAQRDMASRQLELNRQEMDALSEALEASRHGFRSEVGNHNITRKELMALKQESHTIQRRWHNQLEELKKQLSVQGKHYKCRLAEKDSLNEVSLGDGKLLEEERHRLLDQIGRLSSQIKVQKEVQLYARAQYLARIRELQDQLTASSEAIQPIMCPVTAKLEGGGHTLQNPIVNGVPFWYRGCISEEFKKEVGAAIRISGKHVLKKLPEVSLTKPSDAARKTKFDALASKEELRETDAYFSRRNVRKTTISNCLLLSNTFDSVNESVSAKQQPLAVEWSKEAVIVECGLKEREIQKIITVYVE